MSRILIIEDEHSLCDVYRSILTSEFDDITCEAVHTAQEGIDKLNAEHYDCMLLDYHLPDMDGLEFYEHIKPIHNPMPPTIIITSDDTSQVRHAAKKLGCFQMIIKGKDIEHFDDKLIHYVDAALKQSS